MCEITHGALTIVKPPPRCDSEFVREFVPKIESTVKDGASDEIIVDLSRTTFMDSASMGVLLLLRDRALAHGRVVALANAGGELYGALRLVQFHRLFDLRWIAT